MSAESLLGAEGIVHFLAALYRSGRGWGTCHFPIDPEWGNVEQRCDVQHPKAFFVRLVRAAAGSQRPNRTAVRNVIGKCQLTEGIAVFMTLSWMEMRITRCSLQVIVAPEHDLETLYWRRRCKAHYDRLDYSDEERGSLFDHPFPHVHTAIDGPPRFHFPLDKDVFPAFALLDFIMRNRHYKRWQNWLLDVYAKQHPEDVPEGEKTPDQLVEAYKVEDDWNLTPQDHRSRFLTRMRNASLRALQSASEDLPKVNPELLKLNYWQ